MIKGGVLWKKKHHKKYNKYLEHQIYNLIRQDEHSALANVVDAFLMIVVLVSVVVAFISTFDLPTHYTTAINTMEMVFVILFTLEYAVRLWTADLMYPELSPTKARLKYAKSGMAIVDLLSILPFYLPMFGLSAGAMRGIKLLRLLRVFKINRYTSSLSLIGNVLKTRASQLLSSIIIILLLMFIASMLMYDIEHQAQPDKFKNAFSAMWWAMSTITTVGYGDIYPITTAGRILSAIITFLGIGLTAIPTGIVSAGFIEQSRKLEAQKAPKLKVEPHHKYCPCCGQPLPDSDEASIIDNV